MSNMNDPIERTPIVLSKLDRCDRCGARALVQTDHLYDKQEEGGVNATMTHLLWCSHHFNKHSESLRKQAFAVHDMRGE